jgi:RimJ/RimL family protein N-acetyltransferase
MNCLSALKRLPSPRVGPWLPAAHSMVDDMGATSKGSAPAKPAEPAGTGPAADRSTWSRSMARRAKSGWHWQWIPIRVLKTRHRERIAQHLLALSARDRYLRFGYPASDERIRHYVAALDFQRDELFGIFNRRLELVAMTHLAYADGETLTGVDGDHQPMAEFAVSVAIETRGRRYGARLFAHATMHARNRHVDRLFIHALSENTPMLRIARHAGATVVHEGGESEAWLQLPGDNIASHMEELISSQAAEINYGLKRLSRVVRFVTELRRRMGTLRKTASQ